ncbi:hypothetical protein KDA23_05595 [Candidatus Saccharibacteria bacterium]|nr:hypothetical protein [Candidatus Saccharibacteria bacterium]
MLTPEEIASINKRNKDIDDSRMWLNRDLRRLRQHFNKEVVDKDGDVVMSGGDGSNEG